jgi:2-hydroxymuconate-semialdehyde hydrolase
MAGSNERSPEVGREVVAAGIRTNYHDLGSGPPLVLLHGSGPGVSSWANWRMTLPYLAERGFRVLAPDIVGFGYTELPDVAVYDLPYWKAHLLGFLDALGLERVGLVGNSFGGALTLAFVAEHPERVDRFVLMGSAGVRFEVTPALERVWGYESSIERMREVLDLMAYDRSLVSDDLARLRYEAAMRPGILETYTSIFGVDDKQAQLDALCTPEDAIAALPHEALVVHGRDDRILPVEVSYTLASLLDRSQLHVFGRCGHWTQIEHAERFNDLVAAFFDEARSGSAV